MPLRRGEGSYPSSLPTAVARSDGGELSKLRLPCRTSTMVKIARGQLSGECFMIDYGNQHSLSSQSRLLSKPSTPLLQPGGLCVHPSKHRHTHRDTEGCPIDRSKVGFSMILEGEPGGRIFCTKRSDTSSEAVVGDQYDPRPGRQRSIDTS